jgi:hypothetical protein
VLQASIPPKDHHDAPGPRLFGPASFERLKYRHPRLEMVVARPDFSGRLALLPQVLGDRRLFLFPGRRSATSRRRSHANPDSRIHVLCESDGTLILGLHPVKARVGTEAACNDAVHAIAALNLGIVNYADGSIGSNFVPRDWKTLSVVTEGKSRVELHLEARKSVPVRLPPGSRGFRAEERIQTENSFETLASKPLAACWPNRRCLARQPQQLRHCPGVRAVTSCRGSAERNYQKTTAGKRHLDARQRGDRLLGGVLGGDLGNVCVDDLAKGGFHD